MTDNPYGVHNENIDSSAPNGNPEPSRPRVGLPEGVQRQKPKELRIAYTLLCFFGVFGAHKFYLGQTAHGIIYLVTALVSLVLSPIPILGILGFLGFVSLVLLTFTDCMTMQEQLERSEQGEKFDAKELVELAKKSFK